MWKYLSEMSDVFISELNVLSINFEYFQSLYWIFFKMVQVDNLEAVFHKSFLFIRKMIFFICVRFPKPLKIYAILTYSTEQK